MTGLDIFSWIVLIVIILTVLVGFVVLAQLPGKIAISNNHPQAKAINMAGWLGLLLTVGVVWIVAMIWANSKPVVAEMADNDLNDLKERITQMEAQLKVLEEKQS